MHVSFFYYCVISYKIGNFYACMKVENLTLLSHYLNDEWFTVGKLYLKNV